MRNRWITLAATLPLLLTFACDVGFSDDDLGDGQPHDAISYDAASEWTRSPLPLAAPPRPSRARAATRAAPPDRRRRAPGPAVVLGARAPRAAAASVGPAAPAPAPPQRAVATAAQRLSTALVKLGRAGSKVAVGPAAAAAPSLEGHYAAVVQGELMLAYDAEMDPRWYAGAPRFVRRRGGKYSLTRPLDTAALPARIAAWRGQRVRLYDHRGRRCEATVKGFALRSRFEYHGNVYFEEDPASLADPPSGYGPARAWESGAAMLVATLGHRRGRCRGALVATLAGAEPVPLLAPAGRAPRALKRRALAITRSLPSYQVMAEEAASWGAEGPRWETRDGHTPTAQLFRDRRSGRRLLAVTATTYGPCDGDVRLTVLCEVSGRGRHAALALLSEQAFAPTLRGLADFDGDGHLEWVTDDSQPMILETHPLELTPEVEAWIPDLTVRGCPC